MNNKKPIAQKALDFIEKTGNKLPHPVSIFIIFSAIVVIFSDIAYRLGINVEYMSLDETVIAVEPVSLLTAEGIRYMFSNAVSNFTGFAPLGTVLVAMLGVGAAESTGLVKTALRFVVLKTPARLITLSVVFAGIMSNIASDAGYVVLVPLGALIFASLGRHPLAGLAAAFSGVSGGFSANLLVSSLDPLLGGISTEAAHLIDSSYTVDPTANWYFMIASTFLITVVGTIITEYIVEPRLGKYDTSQNNQSISENEQINDSHGLKTEETIVPLTDLEKRGLFSAFLSIICFAVVIMLFSLPEGAVLRHPETDALLGNSPFMTGLVPIISLFFFVPALAYGISSGTIKNDKDMAKAVGKSMNTMGDYLVLAFVAGQFVAYFAHTNLGTIVAVSGADFLKATGLTGFALIIAFIFVSSIINLFIGSASAKWAIMAPVFVPMLMQLDYSPELTQLAYRIGDSTTNIISPLMPYFAVIIAFAQKYQKDTGLGTLISIMFPYSVAFLITWTVMLIVWYLAALPIGPGVLMMMN